MKTIKADAVILDVDGTLWDSTPIVARAWQRAIRENGFPDYTVTADLLKGLFGKTMQAIAEQMFPEVSGGQQSKLMDCCCACEHEELEKDDCEICYPGVVSGIKALSGRLPVCIVSNCESGYIELFLKKTGLESYVTDIECFGNTQKSKGENISLVVKRNHFTAPVYIGDTQGDCDAAKAAGVPFILASYGFGTADESAAVIACFDELLELTGGDCR